MSATANEEYGYVLVHFRQEPHGYGERIYMDVSDGDDPRRWLPVNGGEPILESHIGTTGVRDPHIVRNPVTGIWTIIATDLRVFGGERGTEHGGNWYEWSHHGSTSLIIWQSADLVHWSEPHMLDMALRPDGTRMELGMAWACECLWVPDYYPQGHEGGRGAFVLYWSSKVFADDDPRHADQSVVDQVLWGVTTDFTQSTYEYGGVFVSTGGDCIDTTMIQRPLPDGGVRTYRITKDNGFGKGLWMDSTDARRWWQEDARWTRVQTNIGDEYSTGKGLEGPAVFVAHPDERGRRLWYLLVDVIAEVGYRPMVSEDLDQGWLPLDDPGFSLRERTKHGGVASLIRDEYERLRALA